MKKQNQKGALLVEVIAVLGLIALITPILFNQIQRRNEEIIDAQIASEVRAVKDALSAYIQAYENNITQDCPDVFLDVNGNFKDVAHDQECEGYFTEDVLEDVADYFSGNAAAILPEYEMKLYGRTVPVGPDEFRPVIYAIAYRTGGEPNLRRASKIAAMVGVEGGVAVNAGTVSGMNGVWTKQVNNIQQYAVAVTTSFDATTNSAILKDATFSNMQSPGSIQAGTVMATTDLGAMGVFSVSDNSCIIDYMNDNVIIKKKGETTTPTDGGAAVTCAPVFEVDPETKEVHVAGVIRTGKTIAGVSCSAGAASKGACEDIANCVWVPDLTTDDLNDGTCVAEYLLNPEGTSMVDDIKLSSRGGAKLSDILPKWSLMNVRPVTANGNVNITTSDDSAVKCPSGYKYGLVVLPSKLNRTSVGDTEESKLAITAGKQEGSDNTISLAVSGLKSDEEVIVHEYCIYEP